jgi:hypothetical protein
MLGVPNVIAPKPASATIPVMIVRMSVSFLDFTPD